MQLDLKIIGQTAAMADQISQLSHLVIQLYQENQMLRTQMGRTAQKDVEPQDGQR
jgi:hypothetical protein